MMESCVVYAPVMMMSRCTLAGLATVLCFGCSKTSQPGALGIHALGSPELEWEGCPDEIGGPQVDCARLEVPVDWSREDLETTVVLLRRIRAPDSQGDQVWLLDGGPGFAGDSFLDPSFVELVHAAGVDLYIPSHRGTLDRSRLNCPDQTAPDSEAGPWIRGEEWDACVRHLREEWGQGLDSFGSTSAARDVTYAMGLNETAERRLLFGGSYGTLWAQRTLLAGAELIDAAWLDSVVDLEGSLERVDEHADAAMENLLAACSEEDDCARMFTGEPLEQARQAIAAYSDNAGCGQAEGRLHRSEIQRLGNRLLSGSPDSWVIAASVYARLARCSDKDLVALVHAIAVLDAPMEDSSPAGATSVAYNPILNRHILYRELYRFDVTTEEREQFEAQALAQTGAYESIAREAEAFGADWRSPDRFSQPFPETPLILLSGLLDPLDPPAWALSTEQRFPQARLVSVKWAGHSVLRFLGLSKGACGERLFHSFLSGQTPDLECTENLECSRLLGKLKERHRGE